MKKLVMVKSWTSSSWQKIWTKSPATMMTPFLYWHRIMTIAVLHPCKVLTTRRMFLGLKFHLRMFRRTMKIFFILFENLSHSPVRLTWRYFELHKNILLKWNPTLAWIIVILISVASICFSDFSKIINETHLFALFLLNFGSICIQLIFIWLSLYSMYYELFSVPQNHYLKLLYWLNCID